MSAGPFSGGPPSGGPFSGVSAGPPSVSSHHSGGGGAGVGYSSAYGAGYPANYGPPSEAGSVAAYGHSDAQTAPYGGGSPPASGVYSAADLPAPVVPLPSVSYCASAPASGAYPAASLPSGAYPAASLPGGGPFATSAPPSGSFPQSNSYGVSSPNAVGVPVAAPPARWAGPRRSASDDATYEYGYGGAGQDRVQEAAAEAPDSCRNETTV